LGLLAIFACVLCVGSICYRFHSSFGFGFAFGFGLISASIWFWFWFCVVMRREESYHSKSY
jgi:hypothetical protein